MTRKASENEALGATVPPVDAFAPVPRRTVTRGVAPVTYSPWSSPAASLSVPAFAPETIRRVPGTKVVPVGIESLKTVGFESSLPVLVAETVYSTTSPGANTPGCVRSTAVFESVWSKIGA